MRAAEGEVIAILEPFEADALRSDYARATSPSSRSVR